MSRAWTLMLGALCLTQQRNEPEVDLPVNLVWFGLLLVVWESGLNFKSVFYGWKTEYEFARRASTCVGTQLL